MVFALNQERKTNPRSGTKNKLSSTNEEPLLMLFPRTGSCSGMDENGFSAAICNPQQSSCEFFAYEVGNGLSEARTGRT
jgi:hypothetical protein